MFAPEEMLPQDPTFEQENNPQINVLLKKHLPTPKYII